jgi:6-pyruvoyltetrahydropterin/6-carboxytetrahydropterin synthase
LTPTPGRGTMNGAMYTVFKDFTFAAAHAIRGHTGGCQNLHGHNYRVRVQVTAGRLDALGMVIDFADLKRVVGEVLGPFDHRLINDIPPFDQRNTTAELLAEYVFREVAARLDDERLSVARVEVWENDSACAVYTLDPEPERR